MKVRPLAALPLGLFALTIATMIYSYYSDPAYPYTAEPARHGQNHAGHLVLGLLAALTELGLFFLLVQPWRPRGPIVGLVVAVPAVLAWMAVSMFATMHAGGVFFIHFFWFAALGVLVFVAAALRAVQGWRARAASRARRDR